MFEGVVIDKFTNLDAKMFILTHIHKDHLVGLNRKWNGTSPIYCSLKTRDVLIKMRPWINKKQIIGLGYNKVSIIGDLKITLYDANHMEGSAIIHLIQGDSSILYLGDYRIGPGFPWHLEGKIDRLFLDRTFHDYYKLQFPTLEKAASMLSLWIKNMKEEGYNQMYVAYLHYGTCDLLKYANKKYGYTFRFMPQLMIEEEFIICTNLYPNIWNQKSHIMVTPRWKQALNIPKPIIIPSARWFIPRPELVNKVTLDKKGNFRMCFSNHSDRMDNEYVTKRINPELRPYPNPQS